MLDLKKTLALICFVSMSICGAMAAKVSVYWDKSADFTQFLTYAWAKGTPASNPLIDQRIIANVDSELIARGFKKVDAPENADLIVFYHAAVGTETELNPTSIAGWGWRWGDESIDKIPVGQLVVDIGEAKTRKLLWMGSASDVLNEPEKNADKLKEAVSDMFKQFPPSERK